VNLAAARFTAFLLTYFFFFLYLIILIIIAIIIKIIIAIIIKIIIAIIITVILTVQLYYYIGDRTVGQFHKLFTFNGLQALSETTVKIKLDSSVSSLSTTLKPFLSCFRTLIFSLQSEPEKQFLTPQRQAKKKATQTEWPFFLPGQHSLFFPRLPPPVLIQQRGAHPVLWQLSQPCGAQRPASALPEPVSYRPVAQVAGVLGAALELRVRDAHA
jgi:hypothetical protein